MRARVRDTELYFDVDGPALVKDGTRARERPTAFLVHGGPGGDHLSFKSSYGSLTDRMQLVYFDHRGHGRSQRGDPNKYTLDENVEDMEALRRYLGLGSIVSIGSSYGGMVALAHAARYPPAVAKLILVVTVSHHGYADRAMEIVRERGSPEQIEQCGNLFEGRIDSVAKHEAYLEVMWPLYSCKYPASPAGLLGASTFEPEPLKRAHGPGGFLRSFDLRPELKNITARTLILAGRHDWICAPEFSAEMHRLIPGSDLRIFEESSHAIVLDEPQRILDAIRGFLVY
jgi:proline iminopeptidase